MLRCGMTALAFHTSVAFVPSLLGISAEARSLLVVRHGVSSRTATLSCRYGHCAVL